MKVVVFHTHLASVGGAEILLVAQAQALAARGHDVELACFSCDRAVWEPRVAGLPIRSLDEPPWLRAVETAFAPSPRRLAFATDALRRADVVIAHNYPASALAGAVAGDKAIWYCHEPPRLLYPRETQPHAYEARSLRPSSSAAARQMFVTGLRAAAEDVLGGPWERLRAFDQAGVAKLSDVWPNGAFSRGAMKRAYGRDCATVVTPMVPDPGLLPTRSGLGRPLRVLCQSRLAPEKNTDLALRAFAKFVARHPGSTLSIVGGGGQLSRLTRLADSLGIAKSTRLLGHLSAAELEQAYADADVFLAVPLDEPFGMVFVEAALRGLLVVASNHGGPVEIFDDGTLAELTDPLDPEAIAEALSRVVAMRDADVDERRRRAAAKMRAHYVTDVGTARFLAAFEKATS